VILIVRGQSGLKVLRASKLNWKVNPGKEGLRWENVLERNGADQLYPQETLIAQGAHAVEGMENPFVPGGEPWLALEGSRIGAAEAYIKRLCAATQGAGNAIEFVSEE
jgi:hypothetical protein